MSFLRWNLINYHLPQQNDSIYLLFAALMLIKPVINIILEIKRFLVCPQCVIWVLLFLVTSNGANMFAAMSLKLLFIHTKIFGFNCNNAWILLKAYVTYITPLLEYNRIIWSLFLKKNISMIECVQKCFTKNICFCCNISKIPTLYTFIT